MFRRKIFSKKKNRKNYFFVFVLLLIIIVIISYIFFPLNVDKIFIIEENQNNYYIIPDDKKGKYIPNTNKKILHYNESDNQTKTIINNDIKFSIQLYSSSNYDDILNKRNYFLNNSFFEINELAIVDLTHDLGIDYLLVYKNFNERSEAYNYCSKNILKFIENCLIVNVHNLN